MDMSLSKLWKIVKVRESWHATSHEVIKSHTWLSYRTAKATATTDGSRGWCILNELNFIGIWSFAIPCLPEMYQIKNVSLQLMRRVVPESHFRTRQNHNGNNNNNNNETCDSHSRGFLVVKNLPANPGDVKDVDSIPGSGRSSEGEHGNLLQYSCLENPMDRGAWYATIHGITKSFSGLSDCYYYHHSKQFYYNFWSMVKLRI